MDISTNSIFELLENTNRSVFLTGKAGTGKTTFLNDFTKRTSKKYIVVAPTGIAAINANGVTIHSMFGLPLRTFVPTTERVDANLANNIPDFRKHMKFRSEKIKLLREIDIVIIDEVSMLRADVLDMVDMVLRNVRRNEKPFGGVQMLFIGDLYQLSPVVREESILNKYYPSIFFFNSIAIKKISLISVELTKVHRQKDEKFLKILDDIREGNQYKMDFDELNRRYQPDFNPKDKSYVYLTSHNNIAQEINHQKLDELKGESYTYRAIIKGNFPENQYPNDEKIELKVGTQIMFIRNDASSERRYYNGKLAKVTKLSERGIWVQIEGENKDYQLKLEAWEHRKYSLDDDKNVVEKVLGSFTQYPICLAWAVTIHKSQGLTFDRLIIDAGKSFTAGQVYVALSRCRTLEGIVLKSRINPSVIFPNYQVDDFQCNTNIDNQQMSDILEAEKYDYAIKKVLSRLYPLWISESLENWYSQAISISELNILEVKMMYNLTSQSIKELIKIYNKLENFIIQKNQKLTRGEVSWKEIETKLKGAVNFFYKEINDKIFVNLNEMYEKYQYDDTLEDYNENFRLFITDLKDYFRDLRETTLLGKLLFGDT